MRISRRDFVALASVFSSGGVSAQGQYPGTGYRTYAACLPQYLTELATTVYRRRERAIAALTNRSAIASRQKWVRDTFWKLTGGEPARTPLNIKTHGDLARDGYRLQKLTYESQPGLIIPANLYIPAGGAAPYPGVLFQMGHSLNGKAWESYQKCCQSLARLGYVVLAFDPMGQGERTYYPRPNGTLTRLSSADDEHTVPGRQMLLVGDTATRMQTWDAVRSLDVLASHPLVDPKRLASTGQSGGGTLTMMLAAVDDRLSVAAVASGNTENFACRNFNSPGSTDDAEQNFIGAGPLGFDRWDLLYPMAPKPLLVLASARDFFGTYSSNYLHSGWEEYQKLERVYATLGAKAKIAWADTPLPHGLTYSFRLKIYNWFARWLKDSTQPIDREPQIVVEKEEILRVGGSGNVVRDFGSTTPHRIAVATCPPRGDGDWKQSVQLRVPAQPGLRTLARVPSEEIAIEAVELAVNRHVYLAGWLFLPENPKSVLLVSDPAGRVARWQEGALHQKLAAKGVAVCSMDVRGIGEMNPEFGRGAAGHAQSHHSEENYAWASLMLGEPLVLQRAADLVAVARGLRSRFSSLAISLASSGRLTVPAMFAAAECKEIGTTYLAGGLVSFRSIVESEEYSHPLANFLPSFLKHGDLPDVASAAAPRKLILAGPTDATGRAVALSQAREIYGAITNVEVREAAPWDLETLATLVVG